MTRLLGALAGVVAMLALLVAVPAQWVATHLSDADGFVGLAGPIIDDPDVRTGLGSAIGQQVAARVGLSDRLGPVVEDVLARATTSVADDPAFRSAWEDTMRRSHEATLGDPTGVDPEQDQSLRLAVDLAPLARYVVESATADLPVSVPTPEAVVVPITGAPAGEQLDLVRSAPDYALTAWIVLAVAVVVRLALSGRRGAALARLGAGTLGVAGLLWLAARGAGRVAESAGTASDPFAETVRDALLERCTSSFDASLLVVAVVGAVALVGGLVLRRR